MRARSKLSSTPLPLVLSGSRRGFGLGNSDRLGYWWSVDVATVATDGPGGEVQGTALRRTPESPAGGAFFFDILRTQNPENRRGALQKIDILGRNTPYGMTLGPFAFASRRVSRCSRLNKSRRTSHLP
ncbi:BQ5605_C036g11516 [Microbotryum silenes-dioicae]|uniref:BQ5605_C036g11516 protein n=1 Tax=Microbotryum silenes-dioicae TaxID=796604 RepID=A0A2X0PAI3_9BASI|nr:BQ5605_C036g11516 [Microbotryum silenes-dioicae]